MIAGIVAICTSLPNQRQPGRRTTAAVARCRIRMVRLALPVPTCASRSTGIAMSGPVRNQSSSLPGGRRRSLVAFLLLLIGAASDQAHSGAEAINDRSVTPPSSFEIPFKGPGQLATIWSWGPNRPESGKALVLTRREGTKRITEIGRAHV